MVVRVMVESLRTLLDGVIDYAGLFPPASLPLPEAWRTFAEHRQGAQRWLTSAFVCPASKFDALATLALETPEADGPWPVSLLAGAASTRQEAAASWEREARAVAARRGALEPESGERLALVAAEIKLPADALADLSNLEYLLAELIVAFDLAPAARGARVFFELPRVEPWERTVVEAADALDRLPDEQRRAAGLKIRTGGTEPAAFPSPQDVAAFVVICRDYDVTWKATAGLHHPLRHLNAGAGCRMHGFVNLLTAAVLAEAHLLEVDEVEELLADESVGSFAFNDDQLAWHDLTATNSIIHAVRQRRFVSIGSCSIDEPLDDLRGLAWL